MSARVTIAQRLRYLADRLDPKGAPRRTPWSFTFENHVGATFHEVHEDGRGCPLWYFGRADYGRAHDESGS